MKTTFAYLASAALLTVGLVKMAVQASTQSTLLVPTCLGQSVALPVASAGTPLLHCWGCYTAALGAVGLTVLAANGLKQTRQRRVSALS